MTDEIGILGHVGLADSLKAEFELINKHDNDLQARTGSLLKSLEAIRVEVIAAFLEISNERWRLLAESKRIGAIAAEALKGLKLFKHTLQ